MCTCCNTRRAFPEALDQFDPACVWCGARLLKAIWALRFTRDPRWVKAQGQKVLADWMEQGHSEAELRRLMATEFPVKPAETGLGVNGASGRRGGMNHR